MKRAVLLTLAVLTLPVAFAPDVWKLAARDNNPRAVVGGWAIILHPERGGGARAEQFAVQL